MTRKYCTILSLFLVSVSLVLGQSSGGQRGRNIQTSSLTSEARKLAGDFWSKYLIKCGASYFLYTDNRLFEFRDTPQFGFQGEALTPKPLSRAEILNGVDPLPVEWDGNIGVSFSLCRMNTSYYGRGKTFWHGWRQWSSNGCGFSARISRAKGNWQLAQPKQLSCSDLSSWGFVFIPEGVRGAEAEARAELDAVTGAMLKDASRLGIYISKAPSFPMEYFRSIYATAKRDGLYKAKFFANGYYATWTHQGYGYDHKFPDEMESAFRGVIKKSSHALREAEITSDGRWIVVASGSYVRGDFFDYAAKNIPQSMIDAIDELKRESDKYYSPHMDKDHSPRLIAFGPNDTWVILYGNNRWKCHCDAKLSAGLELSVRYGALKQVAFHPNGGFLILSGDDFFYASQLPKDLLDRLGELNRANQRIDQVIFMPNGSWAIAGTFKML